MTRVLVFMILALTVGLIRAVEQGPPSRVTAFTSATQVVSPVASVTWVARYDSDGVRFLDLLVIWRGSPGWFIADGSGTSGGGSFGTFHQTIRYGDVGLELEFDSATRIARVQGQAVEVGNANVILVDEVGTPYGPKIAGTLRVEPSFPPESRVEAVLRRSLELVSFLRCEVPMPDPKWQPIIDRLCSQLVNR